MATSSERPNRALGMRPLPRPYVAATILRIAALLVVVTGVAVAVLVWWIMPQGPAVPVWQKALDSLVVVVSAVVGATIFYGLALLLEYGYQTALNIRMAERRHLQREGGLEATGSSAAEPPAFNDQVVALLREINENSLLGDSDKARKRVRLAESRRENKIVEIQRLITATKWAMARQRIDDFRAEYPDDEAVGALRRQLDGAIKEHRQVEVMTAGEQIRSYVSLGLWDRAREAAEQLARKYPDDPEAQKMREVVDMEELAHQREDIQRLYREIEHLVNRKHYREAKRAAETLIDRYGESPEAATLRGQMDELTRNADIEARREMEAQIIEHTRQNRHKEAYEIACLLMEQYPESPQALALKDQIEKLRERAGIVL